MVEVSDSLRSLFSATIEERGGRYVVEVPASEVDHDALAPGETYRVALLESSATDEESTRSRTADDRGRDDDPNGGSDHQEPPVDEGEIREVRVESVGDQGDGIAKVERGYVVIVPGADPGDEPTVEIDQVRENVAFASVIEDDAGTGL